MKNADWSAFALVGRYLRYVRQEWSVSRPIAQATTQKRHTLHATKGARTGTGTGTNTYLRAELLEAHLPLLRRDAPLKPPPHRRLRKYYQLPHHLERVSAVSPTRYRLQNTKKKHRGAYTQYST